MEGVQPPAALALLLRADLRGPAKRKGKRLLQCWLALDLAADVGDDPAQPAAQDTQLPLMPPELFGMGVAARHHRGGLGHARIGLPQPDAVPSRQAVEPRQRGWKLYSFHARRWSASAKARPPRLTSSG